MATHSDATFATFTCMPSAYFVSDIHITSPDSPRARLFLSFLHKLSGRNNATHLFLLGDIFDLWVADHRCFVDRYREIIDEIRRLRDEGVAISYFEGNHDIHLGYYWADELGLAVHVGPAYVQLGEKTVRLEHGDQMDPDDKGYLFLRWFLRTGAVRLLIRKLPGALVSRIGDRASSQSRRYTSRSKVIRPAEAIAKIRAHARRAYARDPFDLIISGHVHVRDDCRIESESGTFRSVNLGSWFDAPCYFKIEGADERFYECNDECPPTPMLQETGHPTTVQ